MAVALILKKGKGKKSTVKKTEEDQEPEDYCEECPNKANEEHLLVMDKNQNNWEDVSTKL